MERPGRDPPRGSRPAGLTGDILDDPLLCEVVQQCQDDLARHGFHLDGTTTTGERVWVQFRRRWHDRRGHPGTQVLLLVHGRKERALLIDEYFVDAELELHTPQRKVLRRYDAADALPDLARDAANAVRDWLS